MRLHLFEWEDQNWLPVVFRDFITDHLHYGLSQKIREPVNRIIAKKLRALLARARSNRIVDLCSGAGGPLLKVHGILCRDRDTPIELVLTDLFPNVEAFRKCEAAGGGAIKARYESTDAFDVPSSLDGVRTIFTALHHFRPRDAQRLLADAASKRQPIAVFEPLERTPRVFLMVALNTLWQTFALTPIVGRLTLQRFLLTYVIPLAPFMILWDGLVSVLRTYTPQELQTLADDIGAPGYEWEAGRFDVPTPLGRMPTLYLVGFPSDEPARTARD